MNNFAPSTRPPSSSRSVERVAPGSGSITLASVLSCLILSRLVRRVPYMHISFYRSSSLSLFALSSARVLRYATHVALWPFLLEILPFVQLGASDPGHSIPFFISSFLRLISSRLRSPLHKADSNYTRDTGIPPRVRSAGQLKNNRSSWPRSYSLYLAPFSFFSALLMVFPAGTCEER